MWAHIRLARSLSELSGYGSEAAFSRRFTRHFGMSPSQMREQSRAESADESNVPGWQPLLAGRRLRETASLVRSRAGGKGAQASVISANMLTGLPPGRTGG